jgi:DNA-binding PadR family transcriptional regulator
MSLRYALLGYLYDTSMSGYDLAKAFDYSVGFFWNASHSQIYPELSKMEKEGLLSSQRVEQEGRPSKTLYTATAKGREEFIHWMKEPTKLAVTRDPFLIKTFFIDRLDPQEAIELIDEQLQLLRELLDVYKNLRKIGRKATAELGNPFHLLTKLLTLDAGIMHTETEIKWCEKAKKLLKHPT